MNKQTLIMVSVISLTIPLKTFAWCTSQDTLPWCWGELVTVTGELHYNDSYGNNVATSKSITVAGDVNQVCGKTTTLELSARLSTPSPIKSVPCVPWTTISPVDTGHYTIMKDVTLGGDWWVKLNPSPTTDNGCLAVSGRGTTWPDVMYRMGKFVPGNCAGITEKIVAWCPITRDKTAGIINARYPIVQQYTIPFTVQYENGGSGSGSIKCTYTYNALGYGTGEIELSPTHLDLTANGNLTAEGSFQLRHRTTGQYVTKARISYQSDPAVNISLNSAGSGNLLPTTIPVRSGEWETTVLYATVVMREPGHKTYTVRLTIDWM